MDLLILKGQFLVKDVKKRAISAFSNRRGDDNASDGGKKSISMLGLVILGGLTVLVLGAAVAYITGGLDEFKTKMDSLKNLVP